MSAPERLRFGGIGSENRQPNACEGQQSCERHASHLFLAPRKGLEIDFGVRSYRQNIATVACNSRNCIDFFVQGVCEICTRYNGYYWQNRAHGTYSNHALDCLNLPVTTSSKCRWVVRLDFGMLSRMRAP